MDDSVANIVEHVELTNAEKETIRIIHEFVENFFRDPKFDASHDFAHVRRVTDIAISIWKKEQLTRPLNIFTILLGALLHDVEDKKYSTAEELQQSKIEAVILGCGLPEQSAARIKKLVDGVSYSSEVKDPEKVQRLVHEIPELAVVQDADRLDALGAIGIARCFTFGGANGVRSIDESVQHFTDKLLKLEGMMKTKTGQKMAAERTQRIRDFLSWREDESLS